MSIGRRGQLDGRPAGIHSVRITLAPLATTDSSPIKPVLVEQAPAPVAVLDATSGELRASAVAPLAFRAFVADDLVIASVTDAIGIPRVAVGRISTGAAS